MDSEKAWGLFNLHLNGVLRFFDCYGMAVYFPQVKAEIMKLAEQLIKDLEV